MEEPTMTTLFQQEIPCANCGSVHEFMVMGSTTTFGSPDLDLRPAEMARYTMDQWVQHCPVCGYCAARLDDDIEGAGEVLETEDYQRFAWEAGESLGARFRCASLLYEGGGRRVEAAWAAHCEAWAHDDAGPQDRAAAARERTLALLEKAHQAGGHLGRDREGDGLIRVDLLRRLGRFEEARERVHRLLAGEDPVAGADLSDEARTLLTYQAELISAGDTAAHTTDEAGL
jgi:hypothetical protein